MTTLEPKYTLFDSVEQMLAPETLSELISQPIIWVDCQSITEHNGVAGGKLSYVNTNAGRLVLKQMSLKHDWLMYASDDHQCRSVTLWQFGLLDQLQPDVEHKIVACAHDDAGWGILMHDLSEGLFDQWDKPIPPKLVPAYLDRMAKIHATFWNDPHLDDPRLGLCDSATRLDICSPKLAHTHKGDQRGPIPEWIRGGWEIMETALDRDVFLGLSRLRDDPQPLFDAMNRHPFTLVHGDYRDANLAYLKLDQTVIFDWQQAARSLMTVDFAWFAGNGYVQNTMGKTQTIQYYRRCLEAYLGRRFADMDWQAMIALGYLYNNLFITCLTAYFSIHADNPEMRASFEMDLAERNQQVRDAMRWL